MTDYEVISIAITAATVFVVAERMSPIVSGKHAIGRIDQSIDAVIKGFGIARPSEPSMRALAIATQFFVDDDRGRKIINARVARFEAGEKGVHEYELLTGKSLFDIFFQGLS